MAAIDTKQSNSGVYQSDADAQASKRTSIGLSAHRPTAPDTVQRPPNAGLALSAWWLVFFLTVLMLAVGILVAARAFDSVTTWEELVAVIRPAPTTGAPFHDAFKTDQGLLPAIAIPDQAALAVLPVEGVYRMDVWPGFLAWSRFTLGHAGVSQIDAIATIDAATPDAAVALIGRFVDARNFYLFTVDGQGRFGVTQYIDGVAQELYAPTALAALATAGGANQLTLTDDGAVLHFASNAAALVDIAVDAAPVPAALGVGALATGVESAVVTFDEIGISTP